MKTPMIFRLILLATFALAGTIYAAAQDQTFSTGDVVEAHSYIFTPPWHQAKIISVGDPCDAARPYRVHFIGPDAGDHGDPCMLPSEVRSIAAITAVPPAQN